MRSVGTLLRIRLVSVAGKVPHTSLSLVTRLIEYLDPTGIEPHPAPRHDFPLVLLALGAQRPDGLIEALSKHRSQQLIRECVQADDGLTAEHPFGDIPHEL